MTNDMVEHYGEKVVAELKKGKSLEQAYSNVVGQTIADKFVGMLIDTISSEQK